MKQLAQQGWSAAPMMLALFTLALRVLAPGPAHATPPSAPARAFTPPLAFALAARAPGVDEFCEVDSDASSARLLLHEGAAAIAHRVHGTLRLQADGSLGGAELVLTPVDPAATRTKTLRLHIAASPVRTSPVPGLHAARPAVRLVGEGASVPAALELAWMRLPGPRILLDAVTPPALTLEGVVRPAGGRRPWDRAADGILSLRLSLRVTRDH